MLSETDEETLSSSPKRFSSFIARKEVQQALRAWVFWAVTLGGLGYLFIPHLMSDSASQTMDIVKSTFMTFYYASVPVAAVVLGIATQTVLHNRHTGTTPPPDENPAIETNQMANIVWVMISSVLCVFLLVWGLVVENVVAEPSRAANAMVVNVTGQQWVWTFNYPVAHKDTNELYLPVDQPVIFKVQSKDVTHAFWIVQMGIKINANRGEITETAVTPNKIGVFDVRCAELCGLLHAHMQTRVHVVSKANYEKWLAEQGSVEQWPAS
ncbi:MAG: cytochrome c oxidase subunit II [Actinomycetes bacterium]